MEIVHVYQRIRKDFGRSCTHFETTGVETIIDLKPDPAQTTKFIVRNPVNVGVQCAPLTSEHFVNIIHLYLSANTNNNRQTLKQKS
jgi:hypothetical protein